MATQLLRALQYHGGKASLARWILRQLPPQGTYSTYLEPFAGMLSVLLNRLPVQHEIVNDSALHIVDWWRVVRDRPDELAAKLNDTPYSRIELARAIQGYDNPYLDPVECARMLTIILTWGWAGKIDQSMPSMAVSPPRPDVHRVFTERLPALADRMRHVSLECGDGVELIERYDRTGVVMYVDPPYPATTGYKQAVSHADLLDALLDIQHAQILLSGYEGQFDVLLEDGWTTETLARHTTMPYADHVESDDTLRVNCTWANYPRPQQSLFD